MELLILAAVIAYFCAMAYYHGKTQGKKEQERLDDDWKDPRRRFRPPRN